MPVIQLENVHVDFPIYTGGMNYSLRRRILEITSGSRIVRPRENTVIVRALNGVSFSVEENERIGLIGRNGAGKTTLLRTVGGFCEPERGKLHVGGECTTLLGMSGGMDVERTGYENIHFMGMLWGLTKRQIQAIIPDIEEFTELGEHLDLPVRTYSAGMVVRLGFAIITAVQPEILLVDEIIGGGDTFFIHKARERAVSFYHRSKVLMLASHSGDIIRELCTRVLLLEEGRIVADGAPEEIIRLYESGDYRDLVPPPTE